MLTLFDPLTTRLLQSGSDDGGDGADTGDEHTTEVGADDTSAGGESGGAGGAEDESSPSDWRTQLPDEFKDHASLKDLKTVGDVVKKLVNAETKIGAKGIIRPKKDAPKAEWDKYYSALGRPDSPEKYEVPTGNLPEGVEIDKAIVQQFHQQAHKIGLTNEQAAELIRFQMNLVSEQQAALTQQHNTAIETATKALRKEFGAGYDEQMALARGAVEHFGGDEFAKELDASGLGNHPSLIKAFAKIGKLMDVDPIHGKGSSRSFRMTPAEAQTEMARLRSDAGFLRQYESADDPDHKNAVQKMRELGEMAYPESQE